LAIGAGVVLAAAVLARQSKPSVVEVNLFRLINELPSTVRPPLLGVMQLGALGAVPALAAVALVRNRPRLARMLAVGGTAAWAVAKLLQTVVDQEPPEIVLPHVLLHGATQAGLAFPATHVAVAAAMATVGGPYLSRPNRRLAWWGVTVIAVARVYVGAHFPVDVVGGAAVGFAIGSLVRLCLGSPHGLPSASNVRGAMVRHGDVDASVDALGSSARGAALFRVRRDDGEQLVAKVMGRDQPESDWLYRSWRLLAFRELDDAVIGGSPMRRAEHEAYLLLLAARAALRVPTVKVTESIGDDEALLLRSWVDGCRLADLDAGEVDDSTLIALWRQLDGFHAADILLGTIRLTDVVVDGPGQVCVVDLGGARVGGNADDRARDFAELCALLALSFGPSRAVTTAAMVFTDDQLKQGLRFLQPLALSQPTRRLVARQNGSLQRLRQELGAKVGVDASPLEVPSRIAMRNLLPLVGALFAVNLLLPQVGQAQAAWAALGQASIPWLAATAAAGALTYLMSAIALIGAAGQRLAVGRTWAVQVAAAFTNRLAPAGLGGMATNVRYLEAGGGPRSAAVAAVGLSQAAGFLVHLAGVLLILPLLGGRTHFRLNGPDFPDQWPVLLVVAGALAAIGAVFWGTRIRGRVGPSVRTALLGLARVVRKPRAAAALFGGAAGVTAGYALALAASAQAMSVGLPLATIVAIYLGGAAVAAAAPTPGGLGALEAALVAGLTAAGAATGPAVATVLSYRLITYWLPVVPGLVAFRVLRRSGTL
jgi:undecaprenyl-diphosphatase